MITHETYECEVCGDTFETEEECAVHELCHDLIDIFASGARFYEEDGTKIELTDDLTCGELCSSTFGIVSPSKAVAEAIDHIFDECGYCKPFEIPGTDAHRIVYNEDSYGWFDVDIAINSIKKRVGE